MAAKLAGKGGGRFNVEANSEINVTPFVDVMLVLLIIFMVAAPMAAVTVKVDLPPAIAKPSTNPPKPVYISMQHDGDLYLGDHLTSIPDLPDDIAAAVGTRNPQKERIYIRGDKEVLYSQFMAVMNQLQDNGFYSVALIGTDTNRPGA